MELRNTNHEQDITRNHKICKLFHECMADNTAAHDKLGTPKTKANLIRRGIFQADTLFLLLFLLGALSLYDVLSRTRCIYNCYGKTIKQLLYMDALKLYATND